MKLQIEHTTIFSYSKTVREAVGEARLRPRDDAGQRLLSFQLVLDPSTPFDVVTDHFGNVLHCYSMLVPHRRMMVTATSTVQTSSESLITVPELTLLQRHDFISPSKFVPITAELRDFADTYADAAGDAEATVRALMHAIYTTHTYESGSTDIHTTADAVLAGRRGVCQDFAHLMIALCRSLGLPARYVSGYLFDPRKPVDAILASHAWVEVFLAGRGWLGVDPTHDRVVGEWYVRTAIGRDYADAGPVRGVYQGSAQETLEVRVHMHESA